jgi:hypothetical protein
MRYALATALLVLSSCATSHRPSPAVSPFEFALSLEQCDKLKAERRNYRATEQTAAYVSGAGALVTTVFLAIPATRDERAAQGAAAGVALVAGGVNVFSGSQVNSLDDEIRLGCH